MTRMTILLLTVSSVSAAVGQLLLKKGADGRSEILDFVNAPLILGLAFYAGGVLIWIYALSVEKLVSVYAFTALTFVLVYLGGAFLLHEQISRPALVGIALILAGLYLIAGFESHA